MQENPRGVIAPPSRLPRHLEEDQVDGLEPISFRYSGVGVLLARGNRASGSMGGLIRPSRLWGSFLPSIERVDAHLAPITDTSDMDAWLVRFHATCGVSPLRQGRHGGCFLNLGLQPRLRSYYTTLDPVMLEGPTLFPRRRWEKEARRMANWPTPLPRCSTLGGLKIHDEFSDSYADLLDGRYDCVDPIVRTGDFPLGQQGAGSVVAASVDGLGCDARPGSPPGASWPVQPPGARLC
jgi:hypothetical protein